MIDTPPNGMPEETPEERATLDALKARTQELAAKVRAAEQSIPMLLHCPMCKARHIDVGDFATKSHHTHACQECGHVWRPAIVPTVGVRFLPGFKNV